MGGSRLFELVKLLVPGSLQFQPEVVLLQFGLLGRGIDHLLVRSGSIAEVFLYIAEVRCGTIAQMVIVFNEGL